MKKTMIQFSAAWVPGEGEKEDPNCSINGIVQVIDGKPTDYPAHIIFRDYTEKRPCWWPAVTIPNKKMLSFGPEYGDDELFQTNLHDAPNASQTNASQTHLPKCFPNKPA